MTSQHWKPSNPDQTHCPHKDHLAWHDMHGVLHTAPCTLLMHSLPHQHPLALPVPPHHSHAIRSPALAAPCPQCAAVLAAMTGHPGCYLTRQFVLINETLLLLLLCGQLSWELVQAVLSV